MNEYERLKRKLEHPIFQLRTSHNLTLPEFAALSNGEITDNGVRRAESGEGVLLHTAFAILDIARRLDPDGGWTIESLFPRSETS